LIVRGGGGKKKKGKQKRGSDFKWGRSWITKTKSKKQIRVNWGRKLTGKIGGGKNGKLGKKR